MLPLAHMVAYISVGLSGAVRLVKLEETRPGYPCVHRALLTSWPVIASAAGVVERVRA